VSGAYHALVGDLEDEGAALDAVVRNLDAAGAATPTPAVGWDVRETIAHLGGAAWLAAVALEEPDVFADRLAGTGRPSPPADWTDVLGRWRRERARVVAGLRVADRHDRIPWIAGAMSAMSFASAQLMETWAHGVDVAVALGAPYPATARLRHVAHLGVRARPFTLVQHGLALPDGDVRVELGSPDGDEVWTWAESTVDVVRGDALDFCLVVTQRRHVDDSALQITGAGARAWMEVAQAFAGPPTTAPRGRGV
jgi:uncharacterized protein (TIGR03084 family)